MLKNCEECDNVKEIHRYDLCIIPLTEAEIVLKDDIVSGVDKILPDEKLSLFYIAGYIAYKHKEVCGNDDGSFDDVKSPLSTLDRGKLSYPTTHFFYLVLLAYVFFSETPEKLCRNRLVKIIYEFPETFHVDIYLQSKEPLMRLSNVFFKQFAKLNDKTKTKAGKNAIVKLSSGCTTRK